LGTFQTLGLFLITNYELRITPSHLQGFQNRVGVIKSNKKRGTKSSLITFDKPIIGVNVIGSPEVSGQAIQPEFNSWILFFIGIR